MRAEDMPAAGGKLAVIGENIVDLVPIDGGQSGDDPSFRAIPGGSPANTAIAASRLGTPTALLARIGSDVFGRRIRDRLLADGLDETYLVQATEPSSLAVVSFDDERRASYDFWVTGTADWHWQPGELPDALPTEFGALHLGSIAALNPPGSAEIARLVADERARGQVLISLDPNLRTSIVGNGENIVRQVEDLVTLSHVVKVSDDDLAELYPTRDPREIATEWLKLGPTLVVLTRGGDGAVAFFGEETIEVDAPRIMLVDTVGAGDSFSGALLHGLMRKPDALTNLSREHLTEVVRTATVAAALACTRAGANPATADELAAAIRT